MKSHASVIFIILLGPVNAETVPVPVVTFDMPHGGCRLRVNSDGSGSLAYGALPAWIKVKAGTFLPDALAKELRRIVVPTSEGEHPRPLGSVKFDTSEELFWFSDKELARANYLKALSNAEPPRQMEKAGASVIDEACREV